MVPLKILAKGYSRKFVQKLTLLEIFWQNLKVHGIFENKKVEGILRKT